MLKYQKLSCDFIKYNLKVQNYKFIEYTSNSLKNIGLKDKCTYICS